MFSKQIADPWHKKRLSLHDFFPMGIILGYQINSTFDNERLINSTTTKGAHELIQDQRIIYVPVEMWKPTCRGK